MKRSFYTEFHKDIFDSVSDNESSNAIYLEKYGSDHDWRVYEAQKEMKRFLKGKGVVHGTSSAQLRADEDISIHTKSTSRNPRWPEEHNVVLAELLFEQFVNGNICNSNLRKEQWSILVNILNRHLGTNYSESSVMIRFKNMKADFRTLYQLTNRSGWGWDEELHIPIATEELWEEIVQVTPKLSRFRRHPFHQYEIFENFCGDNIDFENTPSSNLPHATEELTPNSEPTVSQTVGSKRSSDGLGKNTRKPKKKGPIENLNNLLVESNRNAVFFKETVERNDPYTMNDCLQKLCSVENLTTQALLAIQDALKENKDNKTILMTWEGELLHNWIEYVVENHPRFYASKICL